MSASGQVYQRVLLVTYDNPLTRNSGDGIYTASIVDALATIGGRIDIVYFDSNPDAPYVPEDEGLFGKRFCVPFQPKNMLSFIFSLKPSVFVNRYSREYLSAVASALNSEDYDLVLVNHFKMAYCIPFIRARLKADSVLVYISHNVEYLVNRSICNNASFASKFIYLLESLKTRAHEKACLSVCDVVTAISEHDAEAFGSIYGINNVAILRPSISYASHDDSVMRHWDRAIVAGTFTWRPKLINLYHLLNAPNFAKLKKAGVNIMVVGRADPRVVDEINNSYFGVSMTGPVESLLPYYAQAKIAIVPEKLGGGFKLKVAEAALNKAVIIAIKGAITKCSFVPGLHYIECDTYESIVEEVLSLQRIDRQEAAQEMIESAYALGTRLYSVSAIAATLEGFRRRQREEVGVVAQEGVRLTRRP